MGYTTREGGSGSARRALRTRRFTLCRVTERRATFFDTMTAYPWAFLGNTALKLGDERRRPVERAVGNSPRGSRCRRGNTKI